MSKEFQEKIREARMDAEMEPDKFSNLIGGMTNIDEYNDTKVRFKFTKLDDRKPGDAWILLYYGVSKSGKTYFAGTAGPRTLFINIGDGLDTLMSPKFTSRYPESKNMITVDIRENEEKATAFDVITEAIDHALKYFPDKFDTVVLDEATALRKFAMNKAMESNTEMRTKSTRNSRLDQFVVTDVSDYGREMQIIEWFLGTYVPIFKEAGKHFVLLAHERQTFAKPAKIGDEAVLKRITPGFTGKTFPDQVPAYFDDVFRAEVVGGGDNVVYRARTAGTEMEMGGARHGGIFETVERDPNFLKMLARIKAAQPFKRK